MASVGFLSPQPVGAGSGCGPVKRRRKCQKNTRASLQDDMHATRSRLYISSFSKLLYEAQQRMCARIEKIDGQETFSTNPWKSTTGSGNTRVLQLGNVFEKAGVNVSVVSGILSKERADAMISQGRRVSPGSRYQAAALSFVCHAQSPFIPTLRGDVRVFSSEDSFWGGGGVDLTVYYVDRPQIVGFHKFWKKVCDKFDNTLYQRFKKQCDEYFYIPSRGEYRGVGGLFSDDIPLPEESLAPFQAEMLKQFLNSYEPILASQQGKPWTEEQKRWQRIRRGRYLEFNLLNDRGVRFGLSAANLDRSSIDDPASRTKVSRTDSIMISAPPSVEWPYGYSPTLGSPEEETLTLLQGKPTDWANLPIE